MTDKHTVTLDYQVKQARKLKLALARTSRAEHARDRYKLAILWALGEIDTFPFREEGQGAYWWRTELRKRAGMEDT